jgi:hypothetical protein
MPALIAVRDSQGLDGINPLADQDTAPDEHRDEPARACLLPKRVVAILGVKPLVEAIRATWHCAR